MQDLNQDKTDEELVSLVKEGDIDRFGELVERYEKKIQRYGNRFLSGSNSLEDIVQEIFLKAYRNIQSFDVSRKFSSWLYRIAHNEFINEWKKNSRSHFTFMDPELLAIHPAPENPPGEYERQEIARMLEHSLSRVEEKYREILILYFQEDFSYKEIADILQIPVATVGVRLQRGKVRLKKAFDSFDNSKI